MNVVSTPADPSLADLTPVRQAWRKTLTRTASPSVRSRFFNSPALGGHRLHRTRLTLPWIRPGRPNPRPALPALPLGRLLPPTSGGRRKQTAEKTSQPTSKHRAQGWR